MYQRKPSGQPRMALGGLENTSYEVKQISVLVHWNQYSSQTEEAAAGLFEKIRQAGEGGLTVGGTKVHFIRMEFRNRLMWGPMKAACMSGSSGLI